MNKIIFHLAFPVKDIPSTKAFYVDGLGCLVGRESPHSLILGFYGHQIVAHVVDEINEPKGIYPRHFGIVFGEQPNWMALLERVQDKRLKFYQKPRVRFPDTPLEHRTFFLIDPSQNILEFKHYRFEQAIFGATEFNQIGDLPSEANGQAQDNAVNQGSVVLLTV
jgi:extradiol dioxygenase family protein